MMGYLLAIIATALIYMTIWYGISQIVRRSDVADIAWGLGFAVTAWAAYILGSPDTIPALIINIFVTIWGLRLSIHIFLRNKDKPEDARYVKMRESWGTAALWKTYVRVFLTQGLLLLLIAAPVVFANQLHVAEVIFTPWQLLGIIIWIVGFIFESVGDYQLKRFINNPDNRGKLMTKGLWRYTRHPNYFGEVVQWWGIFLLSVATLPAVIGIIGPITITILILKVSGIPMLERKMQQNPNFSAYAQRTNKFWPWPPRTP